MNVINSREPPRSDSLVLPSVLCFIYPGSAHIVPQSFSFLLPGESVVFRFIIHVPAALCKFVHEKETTPTICGCDCSGRCFCRHSKSEHNSKLGLLNEIGWPRWAGREEEERQEEVENGNLEEEESQKLREKKTNSRWQSLVPVSELLETTSE